jgi:hypothetical protein
MHSDANGGTQTGIQVELGFIPLAFFLFFCTPRIEIDGVVQLRPWGTHLFPVAPGAHRVSVWFEYLFIPQCGLNTIDVNVPAGSVAYIKYFMPPWMFAPGSIQLVDGTRQAASQPQAAPAGWHPDPLGRYQVRYWDGLRWTEAVANDGVQSVDAI